MGIGDNLPDGTYPGDPSAPWNRDDYEEYEEDGEEYGLVILKSIMENGEELLSTLDSDEELNEVYDLFMERLLEDDDEE